MRADGFIAEDQAIQNSDVKEVLYPTARVEDDMVTDAGDAIGEIAVSNS